MSSSPAQSAAEYMRSGDRKSAEELVAEIVVRGDVLAAAAPRVRPKRRPGAQRPAAEPRGAALQAIEQIPIADQQTHERDEIVAAPMPADVGLARPHRAARGERAIERRVIHAHVRAKARLGCAAEGHPAASILDDEPAWRKGTQPLDQPRRAARDPRRRARAGPAMRLRERLLLIDHRCSAARGMRVDGIALGPELQGLPMNAGHHLRGHERIAPKHAAQGGGIERPALEHERRVEFAPSPVEHVDVYAQALTGQACAPTVAAVHGQEGRDVKGLVERPAPSARLPLGTTHRQRVHMPLAPGSIGDLGDEAFEARTVRAEAIVEAHGIEDVPGVAHVGEKTHRPLGPAPRGLLGAIAHRLRQRLLGPAEVVAATELCELRRPTDQSQRPSNTCSISSRSR